MHTFRKVPSCSFRLDRNAVQPHRRAGNQILTTSLPLILSHFTLSLPWLFELTALPNGLGSTMTLAYRDFTPALTALVLTLVGFLTYVVYCAIWRLYWSPLAHFPGPRLAALTFWNEFYFDVVLGGKYEWKIAAYHETYGK